MSRQTANQLKKAFRSAARSALNKLIIRGRKVATQKVREVYNIQARLLKDRTKVYKATNQRPEASLVIRGRRMPLILFGAKQSRRGVSVRVKREGGRKLISGAFIATMPSGTPQVWMRLGKSRYPIRMLWTVSPAKMFEKEGAKAFEAIIKKDMASMLKQELTHYLGKS